MKSKGHLHFLLCQSQKRPRRCRKRRSKNRWLTSHECHRLAFPIDSHRDRREFKKVIQSENLCPTTRRRRKKSLKESTPCINQTQLMSGITTPLLIFIIAQQSTTAITCRAYQILEFPSRKSHTMSEKIAAAAQVHFRSNFIIIQRGVELALSHILCNTHRMVAARKFTTFQWCVAIGQQWSIRCCMRKNSQNRDRNGSLSLRRQVKSTNGNFLRTKWARKAPGAVFPSRSSCCSRNVRGNTSISTWTTSTFTQTNINNSWANFSLALSFLLLTFWRFLNVMISRIKYTLSTANFLYDYRKTIDIALLCSPTRTIVILS